MLAEQLPLPKLRVPRKGPVAIVLSLKDVETDDPKVLMAERPNGKLTFPGGKLLRPERGRPVRGARREMWEETGIDIVGDDYLIEAPRSPFRVAVDGREKNIHVFFGFSDEFAITQTPRHSEPTKNGPWSYIPVRKLPEFILSGKLHPLVWRVNWQEIFEDVHQHLEERSEDLRSIQKRDEWMDFRHMPREYGFLEYIHDRDRVRNNTQVPRSFRGS